MRRFKEEEVIDRLEKLYGNERFLFEIERFGKRNEIVIKCTCKKCGAIRTAKFSALVFGNFYCRNCETNKKHKINEDIIKEISYTHDDFSFIVKKENLRLTNKSVIECTCKKCGAKFDRVLYSLKDNNHIICPKCGKQDRYVKIHERYYKDILAKGYDILSFNIKNNRSKIKVRCGKCGEVFETNYFNLQTNNGCRTCQYKKLMTDNGVFLARIKDITKDTVKPIDEYAGINKRIRFRCEVCGNVWETTPSSVLKCGGCPHCSKSTSYPNKLMKRLLLYFLEDLTSLNEEVYLRNMGNGWKGNHKFDFVIETKKHEKVVIEMDGGLGHKDRTTDNRKDGFAIENGYNVIRIDCDYKNIDQRFEFIKKNIIDSELTKVLDFGKINDEVWKKIEIDCLISINKEIYDYCKQNRDKKCAEIAEIFHKSKGTVYKILRNIKTWEKENKV